MGILGNDGASVSWYWGILVEVGVGVEVGVEVGVILDSTYETEAETRARAVKETGEDEWTGTFGCVEGGSDAEG